VSSQEGREPLVYVNGELYPKSEAKISVFDHGLLYGDGVFEGSGSTTASSSSSRSTSTGSTGRRRS
jgi:hypothetical protein